MEIRTGINISTIEVGCLWLVAENYSETKLMLSTLQSFHVTPEDIVWLDNSRVIKVVDFHNYESASSLILTPLHFLNQETLLQIFAEFVKRKKNINN